jgi:hypothetical protein
MIGVRLNGRLGNQLFQYAFGYAAAKKLLTGFYLDQTIEKGIIDKYFDLNGSFLSFLDQTLFNIKGYKIFFTHYLRIFFYKTLNSIVTKSEFRFAIDAPADEVFLKIKNKILYEGYFQSELFFKEYHADLSNHFRVKEKYIQLYNEKFSGLTEQKTVVIHIRRVDYTNLGVLNLGHEDLSLPLLYYQAVFEKLDKDLFFIFISDDRAFVVQNFAYLKHKYISHENEITDFQFMLNADVCVISNSTFSWWAAYLNQKPNKIVYSPQYFLGWRIEKQVPPAIYPESWIQMNVEKGPDVI